jgi:hypothetical protein
MQRALEFFSVGVEQEFVGIESVAGFRLVGAVDAVAVDEAGASIGQVAVKDFIRAVRHFQPRDLTPAGSIENAEFDALGMGGEDGEIDAKPIPMRAHRVRAAGKEFLRDGGHGYATPRADGRGFSEAAVIPDEE